MKILFALLISSVAVLGQPQGFRQNSSYSLFSDYKALNIGDAVTVLVIEQSSATNSTAITSGRSSELGLNLSGELSGSALPGADVNLGTDNNFKGGGTANAGGMVQTKIAATIDSVLSNGNLRISGTRKIVINGEEQVVRIKGIVRPSDVMPNNSVYSFNISDAEIVFEGSGMINDQTEPGWLTKVFHWLF